MPKVSVIVPIFGVEKYIERCARSLFEQTLNDMEIIFVDDCTKDNSIRVLKTTIEDYPTRINQIKILHHEVNKGLSHARETGVKAATGDYIAHCDSDDWVDINMYESLYLFAQKGNYDFVKSGRINSDGKKILSEELVFTEDNRIDQESVIKYLLLQKGWNSIWNTLIKRSIYEEANIVFTNNAMLEDFFLVTQLLLYSKNIGVLNKSFYYYYQNPESICRITNDESVINRSKQAEENITTILNFIHNKFGNKFYHEETALLFIPRRILIPIMNKYRNYKYWRQTTKGVSKRIICSKYINFIEKMWYLEVLFFLRPIIKRFP